MERAIHAAQQTAGHFHALRKETMKKLLITFLIICSPCYAGIFDSEVPNESDSLRQEKTAIVELNKRALTALGNYHKAAFDLVWNNSKFTPGQILDQFGSDAAELFIVSSKVQTLLKEIYPNYEEAVPPYNYTLNQDGTVTVGSKV